MSTPSAPAPGDDKSDRETGALSLPLLLAYALPAIPLAALTLPLYVLVPTYYTEALGLPLAGVGFALLVVQYYWNANAFLIDHSVLPLLPSQAVVISVASLFAGWFIYDRLCKSALGRSTPVLAVCLFVLIVGMARPVASDDHPVREGRRVQIHVAIVRLCLRRVPRRTPARFGRGR